MLDVAIIDYKISNMFSVQSACNYFGLKAAITSDRDEILAARSAILPGVGAFGPAMEHLTGMGLDRVIGEFISSGKPFMGICLGLQLLMTESEEFGTHKGLGIVPGCVRKFSLRDKQGGRIKVPHMGWSRIQIAAQARCEWPVPPLSGVPNGGFMYFVHSFYVVPDNAQTAASWTDYGGVRFCSSLAYKNIFACQFHPEKSGHNGLAILKNFSESVKNEKTHSTVS